MARRYYYRFLSDETKEYFEKQPVKMLKERIVSRAMEFQTHIEFSKFSGSCNCVVELTEDKEPLVFFQPQSDDIGTAASLRLHMGAAVVLKTSNSRTQKHCIGIDTTDSEQSLRVKVRFISCFCASAFLN